MAITHTIAADGTVDVPGFEMAFSSLASREARAAYVKAGAGAGGQPASTDAAALRAWAEEQIIQPLLAKQRARYGDQVDIEPMEIDGVYTEVFTPKNGVSAANSERLLINVHGGGFVVGARTHGQLESIPIAARGEIKVLSIDYRMAPEYTFPAASEDVEVVYRHVLDTYEPQNIGIYGSSAGGMLTAQAVAWLLDKDLPLPGAVGMLGATGQGWAIGDSAFLAQHVYGTLSAREDGAEAPSYFKGKDASSRLAAPILWPEVLAKFPPSLLLTGSRAMEMSSMIDAHNKLTLAGARSRLHVWDGVGHCFYLDPDLPESGAAETIIIDFFDEHLGASDTDSGR